MVAWIDHRDTDSTATYGYVISQTLNVNGSTYVAIVIHDRPLRLSHDDLDVEATRSFLPRIRHARLRDWRSVAPTARTVHRALRLPYAAPKSAKALPGQLRRIGPRSRRWLPSRSSGLSARLP